MLDEKPALVELTFSDGIVRRSRALGRIVQEGNQYFAVATDAHNSIAVGEKILLEKDELERLPSLSPDYRHFRYRKILTSR